MNINKRIKPNLLDPDVERRILRSLKPVDNDYWAPTKQRSLSIWKNWIRPNIFVVIVFALLILFLIYRYRLVKKERETQELKQQLGVYQSMNDSSDANILFNMYLQEKEKMREPVFEKPRLAYPIYPDHHGGTLKH